MGRDAKARPERFGHTLYKETSRPTSRSGWWHLKVRREGIDRQKRGEGANRAFTGERERQRKRERGENERDRNGGCEGGVRRRVDDVMGARETDCRPRRENCSESPTRILGQTEETRGRRCNGLLLSRSYRLQPSRFALTARRVRAGTLVFPIFLLPGPPAPTRLSSSSTFALSGLSWLPRILDYAGDCSAAIFGYRGCRETWGVGEEFGVF